MVRTVAKVAAKHGKQVPLHEDDEDNEDDDEAYVLPVSKGET